MRVPRWKKSASRPTSSNAAGRMFGASIVGTRRFCVINNAIDSTRFAYNQKTRSTLRKTLGIDDDCIVIGHVARLSEEKNQVFLVDIFYEIKKEYEKAQLWIIGEGPSRSDIEKRIDRLNISDSVKLFGQRPDVPELLQAMDAFVITSHREGLCISAVESQAAGLPTFVSTNVPEECKVTNNVVRIPLSYNAKKWAELIIHNLSSDRYDMRAEIIKNGYDIHQSAKDLEDFYVMHTSC